MTNIAIMLYLIRHAQSQMNLAKHLQAAEIKAGNPQVVWDRGLIDAAITPLGAQQIQSARAQAQQLQVRTVYVSPLLRALQTCKGLFQGHPLSPKVIVVPEATEVISDAGDVPQRNLAHRDLFPEYDWTSLERCKSDYWFSEVTDSAQMKEIMRSSKSVEDIVTGLCRSIAQVYPEHFESKPDAQRRVNALREIALKTDGNVAIVGHRDALRSLMRTFLPAGREFLLENCQIFAIPKP